MHTGKGSCLGFASGGLGQTKSSSFRHLGFQGGGLGASALPSFYTQLLPLVVLLVALLRFLSPAPLEAVTTDSAGQRIVWSIPGIADSQILFINRFSAGDDEEWVYYAAPLKSGVQQTISAAITPTQWLNDPSLPDPRLCVVTANLSLWIPTFADWSYAQSSWAGPNWPSAPGEMSLIHADRYTHENVDQMLRIQFNAYWQQSPTNSPVRSGRLKIINIYVFPTADLYGYEGVGDAPWLKGRPDDSLFQPARREKPLGCGLCSRMGLPTFRVNTTVLNPVIEDTDFAYGGLGPEVALRRTYNADASDGGRFGRSWSSSYESFVESHANGAVVHLASGRELSYNWNTNTLTCTAPPGVLDTLVWTTNTPVRPGWGTFRFEERATHQTYHYDAPCGAGTNGRPTITNLVLLTSISDLNSNAITLAYTNGRLSTIRDAGGRTTTLRYSGDGFCTNLTVPGGGSLTYLYDTNGNLRQTVDLVGNVTTYSYSPAGSLTEMDTGGRKWGLQYTWPAQAPAMISAVVNPLGYANTYALREPFLSNRLVVASDALGRQSQYWSRNGMSWQDQNEMGYTTTRTFSNGLVVAATNARGFVRLMAYDARGNLQRLTDETGAVTQFAYTNYDRLAIMSNALGQVQRYTYDGRGNLIESRQPSGRARS
jgi:YD repeat-containing protein